MKKLLCITALLMGSVLMDMGARASEAGRNSIWIKAIDQRGQGIPDATVFYCFEDCVLDRNAFNRKQTATDADGFARIEIGGERLTSRIQGIVKEGFDIRLRSTTQSQIVLEGPDKQPTRTQALNPFGGITVKYSREMIPYSMPQSEPVLTVTGWKLGPPTCLEHDYRVIRHAPPESEWNIRGAEYFYRVGDHGVVRDDGNPESFDFKIRVNRTRYPWSGIFNALFATYRLDLEFREGGAQQLGPGQSPHLAPNHGYKERITEKFRSMGDVSGAHERRFFIQVGDRYGVLNLQILPSRYVAFEYLLNRERGQRRLDLPFYVSDRGYTSDSFRNLGTASNSKPPASEAGVCAK